MRLHAALLLAIPLALLLTACPCHAAGVGFLKDRLATAPVEGEGATAFERTSLTAEDRADLARTGFAPKGALLRVIDSGLHIHRDTPDFDNFVAAVGKRLGNGTCLGMCEIVKNAYEKASFAPGGAGRIDAADLARLVLGLPVRIEGFANMRDLTARAPEAMKAAMDKAHLGNLKPEAWVPWLRDALIPVRGDETWRKIVSRLRHGHPAKISITSAMPVKGRKIGPVAVPLPDPGEFKGHVLLAYKAYEFEGNALVFVYDPNDAYKADRSNSATCLALDRATRDLSLFPAGYAGRYSWTREILCIEGLAGPWAFELKEAFRGFVAGVAETAGDLLDAAREKAREAVDLGREKLDGAGRSLRRGWDAVTRGLRNLF